MRGEEELHLSDAEKSSLRASYGRTAAATLSKPTERRMSHQQKEKGG